MMVSIGIVALLGLGLGLRVGMFGLLLATLVVAIAVPGVMMLVTGETLGSVLPTAAAALAAFEVASLAAMFVRHGVFFGNEPAMAGSRVPARANPSANRSTGATVR